MTHTIRFSDICDCDDREQWAIQNCKSFAYRTITDVTDVSHTIDTIYEFYFGEEQDAMWFQLYWS